MLFTHPSFSWGGGLLAPLVSYATLTLDSTSLTSDGALTVKSASSSLTIIGETNQTGAITIASSSEALTLNLGTGTGAATINVATGASLLHIITLGTASTTISVPASTTFGGSVGFSGLTTNSPIYINSSGVITALASSTAPNIIAATSTAPYFVWQAPAISVVTSSTFPTSPVNGQKILLRAGEDPYEFLEMTYDATYGKWVSETETFLRSTEFSTASNSYTDVGGPPVLPWTVLDAAGLLPQFRAVGQMESNVGGTTGYFQLGWKAGSVGESITAITVLAGSEETVTGTTPLFVDTGWIQIAGGYTVKSFLIPTGQVKRGNTGGETITYKYFMFYMRWVK